MKHIRSPNLAPGDDGLMVMVTVPRGYSKGGLVRAAQKVRGAGRFGDTLLVHINEREFEQLKQAWGAPHYNPSTRLPEFFSIGDALGAVGMGSWGDAIKTVAPYVLSGLTGKANVDQANQNLAPLPDANMQRPLANYTNARQYIPQPKASPSSYYKYGQSGGETQFYKNNSLGAVTGTIPAPLQGPKQYSPSGLSVLGQSVAQGVLGNLAKKYLGSGAPVTADMPLGSGLPAGAFADGAAGAGAAGAGAAGAGAAGAAGETYGSLGALGGTSSGIGGGGSLVGGGIGAEGLGAEGAGAAAGAGSGAAGAGAAGAGAGTGAGMSVLGGLGIGAGALAAGYGVSRILANQGHKTPMDMYHSLNGAYATARDTYNKVTAGMASGQYSMADRAKAWQQLQQAAQGTASYASMLGPDKQAEAKKIYAEFGQKLPDWYSSYLGGIPAGGGRKSKILARGGLAMAAGGPVVKKWLSKLAEAHFNDLRPPRWALSSAPPSADGGRFISEIQSDIPSKWESYLASSQRHFPRGAPPAWTRPSELSLPGGGRFTSEIQSDITPPRLDPVAAREAIRNSGLNSLSYLLNRGERQYGMGLRDRLDTPPLTVKPHFNSDRPMSWERSGSDLLGPDILSEIQSDIPPKGYADGGPVTPNAMNPYTGPSFGVGQGPMAGGARPPMSGAGGLGQAAGLGGGVPPGQLPDMRGSAQFGWGNNTYGSQPGGPLPMGSDAANGNLQSGNWMSALPQGPAAGGASSGFQQKGAPLGGYQTGAGNMGQNTGGPGNGNMYGGGAGPGGQPRDLAAWGMAHGVAGPGGQPAAMPPGQSGPTGGLRSAAGMMGGQPPPFFPTPQMGGTAYGPNGAAGGNFASQGTAYGPQGPAGGNFAGAGSQTGGSTAGYGNQSGAGPGGLPPGGLPRLGQPGGMFGGMRPPMPGMAPPGQPPLPRTGFGMNPAWSPTGSPQQNAMPRPMGMGQPQMIPSPSMQPSMPMRQPMMGGLGRAQAQMGFNRRSEGGAISGPGTGTSDDIPARLSDGEYVIPAHVVAALGDGSTAAGAKRLDQFQQHVRRTTGRQMAVGRHPKPAKLPIDFMNDMMARDDMNRNLRKGIK